MMSMQRGVILVVVVALGIMLLYGSILGSTGHGKGKVIEVAIALPCSRWSEYSGRTIGFYVTTFGESPSFPGFVILKGMNTDEGLYETLTLLPPSSGRRILAEKRWISSVEEEVGKGSVGRLDDFQQADPHGLCGSGNRGLGRVPPNLSTPAPRSPPALRVGEAGGDVTPFATPAPVHPEESWDSTTLMGNYEERVGKISHVAPLGPNRIVITGPWLWSPTTATITSSGDKTFRIVCDNTFLSRMTGRASSGSISWDGDGFWRGNPWKKRDSSPTPLPQTDDLTDSDLEKQIAHYGLTAEEVQGIRDFARILSPPLCHSRRTDTEWASVVSALPPSDQSKVHKLGRTSYLGNNTSIRVPCPDVKGWLNPAGPFRPVPAWNHCCNKGPGIMQCDGDILDPNDITCPVATSIARGCQASALPLCSTHLEYLKKIPGKPVVYGFGIGGEWDFEDYFATRLGCEVHGFDPTTNLRSEHERHRVPGVTFHYRGLRGASENIHRSTGYGQVLGPLYTLEQTMKDLGHKEIHVLRIDCDGCEWESFDQIAKNNPELLKGVKLLIYEVHIAPQFGMRSPADVKYFGRFFNSAMKLGFRVYYYHDNPCPNTHPMLRKLGMDGRICAHEVALYRP